MATRKPEDYPQDHRLYTGLYSAKAFALFRDVLPAVSEDYNDVVPIRDDSGEVVLVTRADAAPLLPPGVLTGQETAPRISCREWMREVVLNHFRRAGVNYRFASETPPAEEFVVLRDFIESGESGLDPEQKKVLARLRGAPKDVLTVELGKCMDEEIKKVEQEHADMARNLLYAANRFSSPFELFGSRSIHPATIPDSVPPPSQDKELVPLDTMTRFGEAERACRQAWNRLAGDIGLYIEAYDGFKKALNAARRGNTANKDARIRAVKKEFNSIKRGKGKANPPG